MLSFAKLRNVVVALTLAGGLLVGSLAQASDCHVPRCYWKTVIVYASVTKPYTAHVVKYDHCGKPFLATVVRYKTVRVPAEKKVKVCY